MDVADPGGLGDSAEHAGDDVAVEAPAVEGDEQIEIVVTFCVVGFEKADELGVERDVAVVVELADRDSEPMPARHEYHCV